MERKFSQRLKCDLPPLIECEGETILDGNKSPDSEASEDSGFCGEVSQYFCRAARKDLIVFFYIVLITEKFFRLKKIGSVFSI